MNFEMDYTLLIARRAAALGAALSDAKAHALYESLCKINGNVEELRVFVRTLSTTLSTLGFMRPDLRAEYERVHTAAISVSNAIWQADRQVRVIIEVSF